MNYLISMYIDNELSLEEKITFVERVHLSAAFKGETVSLLEQEKSLHTVLDRKAPELPLTEILPAKRFALLPRAAGLALAACLLVIFSFLYVDNRSGNVAINEIIPVPASSMQRFVIYQNDVEYAEITGSFTNWERVPLQRAGESGYWHVTLEVPPGEHRYSFILDGGRQLADPTVDERESDDFGSENSILLVGI